MYIYIYIYTYIKIAYLSGSSFREPAAHWTLLINVQNILTSLSLPLSHYTILISYTNQLCE